MEPIQLNIPAHVARLAASHDQEMEKIVDWIRATGREKGEQAILQFHSFLCDHDASQTLRAAADQPEMARLIRMLAGTAFAGALALAAERINAEKAALTKRP